MRFEYYIGFERKSKYGQYNKNNLTTDIIKHFRYVEPIIDYEEKIINIDPYILGLQLGDGNSQKSSLTNIDIHIIDAWKQYANDISCNITLSNIKKRKSDIKLGEIDYVVDYHIINPNEKGYKNSLN